MDEKMIPDIIVGRLPVYLRLLQRMEKQGRKVTSSQELGEILGTSAAQIRKDLSRFGEFGKQGTGYQIDYLIDQIRTILNITKVWDVAIVGAGDIGSALARYQGFVDRGFTIKMIFDNDPALVGKQIGDFFVQDSAHLVPIVRNAGIRVAMIAVPVSSAQIVAEILVEADVKAILSYAPTKLKVPDGVHVQYVDPAILLQRMTYYLGWRGYQ